MNLLAMGNAAILASWYRGGTALIQVGRDAAVGRILLSNVGDDADSSVFVVGADILANNGILHLISGVLPLPALGAPTSTVSPMNDATGPGSSPPAAPTLPPQDSGGVKVIVGRATEIALWLLLTAVALIGTAW